MKLTLKTTYLSATKPNKDDKKYCEHCKSRIKINAIPRKLNNNIVYKVVETCKSCTRLANTINNLDLPIDSLSKFERNQRCQYIRDNQELIRIEQEKAYIAQVDRQVNECKHVPSVKLRRKTID